MPTLEQTYAAVPYVEDAHRGSDPAAFGAVAALHGVDVPDPRRARILEIGCALGGNLLPLAARYPDADLVGIDLSPEQIDRAKDRARRLGLGNVRFLVADLADLPDDLGLFDFIVAHGVYSWVPDPVREAMLPAIRAHLAPGGVAYVSYNTLPGWHGRQRVRDLLRFHVARFDGPEAQAAAAREILAFAAAHATEGPHRDLFAAQAAALADAPDAYLFHDHLEIHHHPVWYREFVAHAARSDLAAVGDALWHTTILRSLPPEAHRALVAWSEDRVAFETYQDVLRDRTFRQTVLVRSDTAHTADPVPDHLGRLHLWTDLRAAEPPTADGTRTYTDGERTITTRRPGLRRLLDALDAAWPGTAPLDRPLADGGAPVAEAVLQLLAHGAATASLCPIDAARAGPRPTAFAIAREQAGRTPRVPSLRHATVVLPDAVRPVVPLLDGTRTPDAIAAATGLSRDVVDQTVAILERRGVLVA